MEDRKVLLIDDNKDVREVFSELLSFSGFMVRNLESGQKILQEIDYYRPNVVLLDWQGIDGRAVCQTIKAQHPDLPVILFSALDNLQERAENAGFDGFIEKPVEAEELICQLTTITSAQGTKVI